jgi:hypothetical protein
MSEYQYVGFRAIDAPVSEKSLEYMHAQSSRAEISSWAFDNEYHYGDFGGNALEMLRRGYGLHLHYANFGTRRLMIRLPHGLPDAKAAKPYLGDELQFVKDKGKDAGILSIDPYFESDARDELWDLPELVDRLVPLAAEIIAGDLRPLYIANLSVALDDNHDPDETSEPPVPAGLEKLSDAQLALAELYGVDEDLLAAAAEKSPALPPQADVQGQYADWLRQMPTASKDALLSRLMADPQSAVRGDLLADFHKDRPRAAWPAVESHRTISELLAAADKAKEEASRRKSQKAARERAKKIAKLAADPEPALRQSEQLMKQRSSDAYRQIACLLADVREALAGSARSSLADEHAQKLKTANPTLRVLTSELRKQGFLKK